LSIVDVIRERGPLTVAAFMELALYDPGFGYYARAAQRSGRAGDFFTSVDVGPVFGALLAEQIAEMAGILAAQSESHQFDLVEAAAGNGRLSADILNALKARHASVYARTALHLVERSAAAREAERATLAEHADRCVSSSAELPETFEGVLFANELLDAMPVHQVVMREDGLREIFVTSGAAAQTAGVSGPRLVAVEGPPSTPALAAYLSNAGVTLEPGWRAEINLAAARWVREAVRRLRRGFIMLFDYGHEAGELYSATHSGGTLTTFSRHVAAGADASAVSPAWLTNPGSRDITAHVDFSTIQNAAHAEGATTLAFLDQTYFVLGIIQSSADSLAAPRSTRALKTLLMPGGLGSTMKALILGKHAGTPPLIGCSFGVRVT
jgi:SAM-dependent MidA family methyltransferase